MDGLCYRVCTEDDIALTRALARPGGFVSACQTQEGARKVLSYPPNPMATRLVELVVMGPVLMGPVYDDGPAGLRKQAEEEVVIPLSSIKVARLLK